MSMISRTVLSPRYDMSVLQTFEIVIHQTPTPYKTIYDLRNTIYARRTTQNAFPKSKIKSVI